MAVVWLGARGKAAEATERVVEAVKVEQEAERLGARAGRLCAH